MKDKSILASVALFRELYDNQKDIYDIIAEFIVAAMIAESKWTINISEARNLIEKVFDFNILDAVIRTTIKNKLEKKGVLIAGENGVYALSMEKINNEKKILVQFDDNKKIHSDLFENLQRYAEDRLGAQLNSRDREELFRNFQEFLLHNGGAEKYSVIVSSFVIDNQANDAFRDNINTIKEGLVLYTGIRFTAELNELGTWSHNMVIFLDTEHLLNAVGLNGVLYGQIFTDFLNLVRDINRDGKNKQGKKKIELRYFEESKFEVEGLFYVAEKLLERQGTLDPSKTAIVEILNGCKSPSQVIAKKADFFQKLKQIGILEEEKINYYRDNKHIVDDPNILENLRKQSAANHRPFDENECLHFLKLFTKINCLRGGNNNNGFDRSGYLLLTAKYYAHFLAHNSLVKTNEKDTPFATDIYFITDKFWFKLKKGFGDKAERPKSFDLVTKAQVILSSQINNSVSKGYYELTEKLRKGEISRESAIAINYELRERAIRPEEITTEVIDDAIAFINDANNIEKHLREKSMLEAKVTEGQKAIFELRQMKNIQWRRKIKPTKILIKFAYWILMTLIILVLVTGGIFEVYLVVKLIPKLTNIYDSIPDLIGLGALLIIEIPSLIKLRKLERAIATRLKKIYVNRISRL